MVSKNTPLGTLLVRADNERAQLQDYRVLIYRGESIPDRIGETAFLNTPGDTFLAEVAGGTFKGEPQGAAASPGAKVWISGLARESYKKAPSMEKLPVNYIPTWEPTQLLEWNGCALSQDCVPTIFPKPLPLTTQPKLSLVVSKPSLIVTTAIQQTTNNQQQTNSMAKKSKNQPAPAVPVAPQVPAAPVPPVAGAPSVPVAPPAPPVVPQAPVPPVAPPVVQQAPPPPAAKPPKVTQNGVSRPGANTQTGSVWDIADRLTSENNGTAPDRHAVLNASHAAGINVATATVQFAKWLKFHGLSTPKAPKVPKAPKGPKHDPLKVAESDGWLAHPSAPGYHYKGQEVKTDTDLAGLYPAPAPVIPEVTPAPPAPPVAPAPVAPPVSSNPVGYDDGYLGYGRYIGGDTSVVNNYPEGSPEAANFLLGWNQAHADKSQPAVN